MKIGLIGFGNLGQAIAKRLIDCGHSIIAWNRNKSILSRYDLEIANSPREVAMSVDAICVCVFDSKAVYEVLTMPDGLLSINVENKIIIDLTTNHYNQPAEFARLCQNSGYSYLESPVLGSVIPASQGLLTILISGDKQAYTKIKPILDDLAKTQFYLQQYGLSSKMKLINNMLLGDLVAVIAEAVSLGEQVGIDSATSLDILGAGAGNSALLNAKKGKLLNKDFSPHFSNKAILKDSYLVEELANEVGYQTIFGSLNIKIYQEAVDKGMAENDLASVYNLFSRFK